MKYKSAVALYASICKQLFCLQDNVGGSPLFSMTWWLGHGDEKRMWGQCSQPPGKREVTRDLCDRMSCQRAGKDNQEGKPTSLVLWASLMP